MNDAETPIPARCGRRGATNDPESVSLPQPDVSSRVSSGDPVEVLAGLITVGLHPPEAGCVSCENARRSAALILAAGWRPPLPDSDSAGCPCGHFGTCDHNLDRSAGPLRRDQPTPQQAVEILRSEAHDALERAASWWEAAKTLNRWGTVHRELHRKALVEITNLTAVRDELAHQRDDHRARADAAEAKLNQVQTEIWTVLDHVDAAEMANPRHALRRIRAIVEREPAALRGDQPGQDATPGPRHPAGSPEGHFPTDPQTPGSANQGTPAAYRGEAAYWLEGDDEIFTAEPDVTPPDPSGRIVDGGPVQPFVDTDLMANEGIELTESLRAKPERPDA